MWQKETWGWALEGGTWDGLEGKCLSNGGRTENVKAMYLYFNLKLKRKKFLEN